MAPGCLPDDVRRCSRTFRGKAFSPLVFVVLLGSAGCQVDRPDASAGTHAVVQQDARALAGDRVIVSHVTELTIPESDGGLWGSPLSVEVDGRGRTWVLFQEQLPAVFGPGGNFLTRIGAEGQGPMEFASVTRVFGLPGDSVALVDPGNSRITVLGPDLEFGRSLRMPLPLSGAAVIRWPDQVLVNAFVPTPEGEGFPLHLADLGADQVRIMGPVGSVRGEGGRGQRETMALRRIVHSTGDGAWVADRYAPRATRWTSARDSVETRASEPEWFGSPLAEIGTRPVPNAIVGVAEGPDSTLLLYASVVDNRALDGIFSAAREAGASEVPASRLPPAASYRQTRVLVLGEGGRLFADLPVNGQVVDVAHDGRALVARVDLLERLRLTLERIEVAGR